MKEMDEEERAARAAGGPGLGHTLPEDLEKEAKRASRAGAADDSSEALLKFAYGLDLGASSLRLAVAKGAGKGPEVVENREGARWTPAMVRSCGNNADGVDTS